MLKLEEMIDVPEGREIKRAIAVKMIILGFKTQDICDVLDVSDSFVSKWKTIYENEGAGGLRLRYKGTRFRAIALCGGLIGGGLPG